MSSMNTASKIRLNFLFVLLFVFTGTAFAQSGPGAIFKENLDLPLDAIGEEEEEHDDIESIVFFGQSYEGDGIFYCLDRSGSTRGHAIRMEKIEVLKNLKDFSEKVQFAITFYDKGLIHYPQTSRPAKASPAQKAAASAWLQSIQSGSGSCFGLGLIKCLDFANQSSAKRNVIIYLGDGCPTCPGDRGPQYSQKILSQVKTLNYKNHTISSIAVGDICPEFPKALANQNGGTYTVLSGS